MIQTLHTIIQTENKIWKGKFSLFIHIFYSFSSELMTLKDFFFPQYLSSNPNILYVLGKHSVIGLYPYPWDSRTGCCHVEQADLELVV